MNPLAITKALTKVRPMLKDFKGSHPKFFPFVRKALKEADTGSVVEIKMTTSEGKEYVTNLKLSDKDMELVKEARNILG